jgi:leucyl aminopeptidase
LIQTVSPSATTAEFTASWGRPQDAAVDLLCVPVFGRDDGLEDVQALVQATGGEWDRARSSGEFTVKLYDAFVTPIVGAGWQARRVAFIGAGPRHEFRPERVWRVGAVASYTAQRRAAGTAGWIVRPGFDTALVAQLAADGLSTAEFDGGTYKQQDDPPRRRLERVEIIVPDGDPAVLDAAVRKGRTIGAAANLARSFANEPGNVLTPREFASRISVAAGEVGLHFDVLDEERLRELRMHLLLAVAQGSAEPARLVVLRHEPPNAPAWPVLGFVGKGITFDSGGISIKPAEGMDRMKDDMAGAAAVAAAMRTLAKLEAPFRVIGVIPTTENMPGGRAMRPGDVIRGASGRTVEVLNTDAEGRLVLGDALWYAGELGATHLVDVATLTGACVVALGRHVSGLFGNDEAWIDEVHDAATRAGDRVWPMPIYEEVAEQLRSEIADMVNSCGRPGGAITAAAFLREFAGGRPWAHLDIAGTAWAESKTAYQPKGATGVAVRTLIELGMTAARLGRGPAG